jgi:hypothetical protein
VGLQKLDFTEQQVSIMKKELEALQPSLIKTVAETEALMAQVSKEKTEVVEPKKAVVNTEVAKAEESAAAANAIKTDCEAALAIAMPVLESALCALAPCLHVHMVLSPWALARGNVGPTLLTACDGIRVAMSACARQLHDCTRNGSRTCKGTKCDEKLPPCSLSAPASHPSPVHVSTSTLSTCITTLASFTCTMW